MKFPVRLSIEGDTGERYFPTDSVNIARNSIQLSCNGDLVAALMAVEKHPQICELCFHMPDSDDDFCVKAQLISNRRLSQHCYHLGLAFIDMEIDEELRLNEHLTGLQLA